MKKLHPKQKMYHLRRLRELEIKRLTRARTVKMRLSSRNYVENKKIVVNKIRLVVPETLSLNSNYDETITFFHELRKFIKSRHQVYIDFRNISYVGPAAALMLAAELDRYRQIKGFRYRVVDVHKWNPNIQRLLNQKGLFDVLEVANPPPAHSPKEGSMIFFKFRSRQRAVGEEVHHLRNEIESVTGQVPNHTAFYRGLSEAMTNVANHAYPEDYDYQTPPLKGKWWMSGSFDPKVRSLTIMFYDQGVGIPTTLPNRHKFGAINRALGRLNLKDEDASRILVAMELGATSTGEANRGGGLCRDIRRYTEQIPQGKFSVLSGKGEYLYVPGESDANLREKLLTRSQSIGGTLIQWEATI